MRGKAAPKRKIQPDVKYKNLSVSKFINYVMEGGKKNVARSIMYGAMDYIKEKTKKDPIEVFERAMKNVGPSMEVRGRRIGGANYQVPVQVRNERKFILASRWILEVARGKSGKPMSEKLAQEFLVASENEGDAIRKKDNVHKMAESNRAFAHFAKF
ncbi:MAG: SSU ribosomal protein S7p (S5e) [Parcubacteria group bacterium Gr01-1014_18]|nr:MAG: SSU ribosomal protein S7p (S5e) [Parcubacteria group bacterium Greene0416_36]TSC80247.1 MAG: SSU ribosomal protein S7p (S5e) [Parcubacteria group bacterium Gr01-1014_18]TSC98226.1 MAG: SSU ribosomal protein S7p (S5e) [Parcubacteria group bacterium Greene1014_20]TSD07031.1 MAG: SSU ribosomal protein S7p (S5e) [Parcubacteria group bacterium Greene0714_2]